MYGKYVTVLVDGIVHTVWVYGVPSMSDLEWDRKALEIVKKQAQEEEEQYKLHQEQYESHQEHTASNISKNVDIVYNGNSFNVVIDGDTNMTRYEWEVVARDKVSNFYNIVKRADSNPHDLVNLLISLENRIHFLEKNISNTSKNNEG